MMIIVERILKKGLMTLGHNFEISIGPKTFVSIRPKKLDKAKVSAFDFVYRVSDHSIITYENSGG